MGAIMEQWVILRKGADFEGIGRKYGISPRMAALIRNRDIVGDAAVDLYLNGTSASLGDGKMLKGMDRAVDILREKIREEKKIRVIGDYDIDGVNAAYILLEGLEAIGASVDSDIPDRIKDGYGLNAQLIERARQAGIDTIITCDNGIAAAEEIAYGKSLGMTVIVTDHHEVPYEDRGGEKHFILPPADAVVDPKQDGCPYPFKGLCGAAVAYKLMEALYEASGRDAKDLEHLIENVAIATVGDVMDLTGENRIFVKEGLKILKRTSNPGLRALIDCTGLKRDGIRAYHIGFVLGPCLNAGGRLDTAKLALALLRAGNEREAHVLAADLKALNDSRKAMTMRAVEQAVVQAEERCGRGEKVLVLYLPDCHESLAGIVAGKVRERFYRPVFVLTDAEEGVKGSGRSIDAYSMYEELTKCNELLIKYGGHRLAAGISMKREDIEQFRHRINESCILSGEDMAEKVVIDMELPFSGVTQEFVRELSLMEPFGKGNTKPVFAGRSIAFTNVRIIGKNRNVIKARAADMDGTCLDAVYFGDAAAFQEKLRSGGGKLTVTYYPEINEYRGEQSLQVVITHYM